MVPRSSEVAVEETDTPVIQPSEPTGDTDEEIRRRVYKAIAAQVTDLLRTRAKLPDHPMGYTAVRLPASERLGQTILTAVTEILFRTAIKEGYIRFPGGFGSLKVHRLHTSTSKRLPSGRVVKLKPARARLRYEEGSAVRDLLGMPKKTNYQRRFERESKLTKRATRAAGFDE